MYTDWLWVATVCEAQDNMILILAVSSTCLGVNVATWAPECAFCNAASFARCSRSVDARTNSARCDMGSKDNATRASDRARFALPAASARMAAAARRLAHCLDCSCRTAMRSWSSASLISTAIHGAHACPSRPCASPLAKAVSMQPSFAPASGACGQHGLTLVANAGEVTLVIRTEVLVSRWEVVAGESRGGVHCSDSLLPSAAHNSHFCTTMAESAGDPPRHLPSVVLSVLGGPSDALSTALERAWAFAGRVGIGLVLLSIASCLWASPSQSSMVSTSSLVVVMWHVLSVAYASFR